MSDLVVVEEASGAIVILESTNNLVVVETTGSTVVVQEVAAANIVEVVSAGPQGIQGLKGDKGDKGDTGDVTPELTAALVAAQTAATNSAGSATSASNSSSSAASSATNSANSASVASTKASESATSASASAASASSAASSATTATTKASEATASATSASGSASTATTKASDAALSATNAANSATTATTKASEAATSATNAAGSASTATTAATTATTQAGNASTSATSAAQNSSSATASAALAQDWATKTSSEVVTGQGFGAKKYANDASASATSASSSASTALGYATTASTKAGEATTSASNAATSATTATTKASEAATSATNAAGSATSASTSATTATTKASEAATSATDAAASATSASGSASTATTRASQAGTSATNAASSATTAGTSATNAANSATSSATSATLAQDWATKTSAEVVTGQGFGAKKYAIDAASSASGASTSASGASTSETNAANSATSAALSASNAANSASAASTSATNAASSASTAQTAATTATTKASDAQYWAGQAASSAVGAVKFDSAQSLTTGQKAQARSNIDLGNVENKSSATIRGEITSGNVTTALGFTPVDSAKIGAANGVASLDSAGLIPSSQLPSYVDDVLEYANLAAFPGSGATGKIYVALDSNKTYRWSGSVYVEISASPGSTDAVTEGSSNLYFTNARARAAVSASGSLSYNASTGVFSYTAPTNVSAFTNDAGYLTSINSSQVTTALGFTPYNSSNPSGYINQAGARSAISVSGSLSYNSTTGVISYTAPTAVSAFTNDSGYLTSASLSSYLTSAAAASTYQTISGMSSYLTTSAASSTYATIANPTHSGTMSFSGTGVRITGDFSNATRASRVLFQTSTANSNTFLSVIPNGTGNGSGVDVHQSGTDPDNSAFGRFAVTATSVNVRSGVSGTGTQLPLTFLIGSSEYARLATSGNFLIGTTTDNTTDRLQVNGSVSATSYAGSGANLTGFTSGQITTALGYTPYNSSNPSGYITSSALSSYLPLSGGTLTGTLTVNGANGVRVFVDGGASLASHLYFANAANNRAWNWQLDENNAAALWGYEGSAWAKYLSVISGSTNLHGARLIFRNANADGGTFALIGLNWEGGTAGTYKDFEVYDYVNGRPMMRLRGATRDLEILGAATISGATVIHAGNYTSYSPSLTGSGASGTWGISVSGNAGTASSTTLLAGLGSYGWSASTNGRSFNNGIQAMFVQGSNGYQSYGSVVRINTYSNDGGSAELYFPYSATYGGSAMQYRLGQYDNAGWTGWKTVLDNSNYNSYALPLSGGTVSGQLYLSANGQGVSNATLKVNGDITAARGNGTTGVIYLGNSGSTYVYYDGANYFMPNGQLDVAGNRVLTAGNYTSYSPSLGGSGASGTWGINVTGNAASATKTNGNAGYGRVGYGMWPFYNWGGSNGGAGAPSDSTYTTGIDVGSHPSDQAYGFQIANNMWNNGLWTRSYNSGWYGWVRLLDSSNFSSYALPLSGGTVTGNTIIGRDLYISGQTGGSFGNRLIVGNTTTSYTLEDTNVRPVIHVHGQYPVLSLNHTVTSNASHGPTVQFTHNGVGRQFVIGTNGSGTRLDIGVSNSTQTDWNPHNGIDNYNGVTGWRMDTAGNVFNYVSSRAPIFYDNDNTGYFVDPANASNFNTIYINGTSANAFGSYWAGAFGYPGYQFAGGNGRFGFSSTGGLVDVYTDGSFYASNDLSGASRLVPVFDYNQGGGALYSSILYDSNNTAYYCDPNSTSNFYDVQLTGAAHKYLYLNPGNGYEAMVRYNGGSGNTWYVGKRVTGDLVGTADFHFYSQAIGATVAGITASGSVYARENVYGLVFYDRDNTGYYLDPTSSGTSLYTAGNLVYGNGGSNTGSFIYHGAGNGDYGVVRFYQSGSNNQTIHAFNTNWQGGSFAGVAAGSINISGANGVTFGAWNVLNGWIDNSGNLQANGSSRAPIFYDSNNTAFYLDPASGGKSMVVNGNLELTARSESWGEGIRINVPTAGTWGGIRFNRSGASGPGNWALGYTGINSTDDLTFWSGTTNTIQLNLDHSGNLIARGNITAYGSPSDRRLKENIQPLTDALNKVLQLQGCTFDWKEDSREHQYVGLREDIGFIADEVQAIIPEMVRQGDDGYLSLRDRGFSALLVEALKEQNQEVVDLRNRVAHLESLINKLIGD